MNTIKSPLDVWRQFVPQGHDQSLRNAFYNVAAAVFVAGAGVAAWSVYLILQPFVKALMWAVLFGSVLHPFKYRVSKTVEEWLRGVQETKSLLSLSMALLPVTLIDNISELVGWYVVNHMKRVIAITIVLPLSYIVIHYTPSVLSSLAYSLVAFIYYGIKLFLDIISYIHLLVLLLVVVYFILVCTQWNPHSKIILRQLSLPMWILFLAALSHYISASAAVPLFLLFCTLLMGGIYIEAKDLEKRKFKADGEKSNFVVNLIEVILGETNAKEEEEKSVKEDEKGREGIPNEKCLEEKEIENKIIPEILPTAIEPAEGIQDDEKEKLKCSLSCPPTSFPKRLSNVPQTVDEKDSSTIDLENSNMYLKGVFLACILVQLWRHSFLLPLLPLTLLYYAIKKSTVYHFYGEGYLKNRAKHYQSKSHDKFTEWLHSRKAVLLPVAVRGLAKLLKRIDRRIVGLLTVSVDAVVTLLVMLAVLMFCVLTTLFLAVQIQGEGMQVVTMGSQLINATIVSNPEFHAMLPEGLNDVLDTALDNGYLYGKEWITNLVRSVLGEVEEGKSEALEKQIIELWDRIYQAWVVPPPVSPFRGPTVTTEAVSITFDSIVDGVFKTPGLISLSSLTDILRDNFGTIVSVLDSVWAILMSNLSLAMSVLTTTSSLLLGSSLSIINALLNLVVFLSALFYVLSVSNSVYRPVSILTSLAPGQMNSIGGAFEDSVNGVFMASFKMGAFYGMWTWLLHSVFGTNIVYVPTVLAALFGAVPLVGTYWAALPGALELFWGHNSPILAILLLTFQLLPLSCVDTAIYAEIKGGGHPYLTGLAVAGGIFCWGVEGAILGPLVLCILLVITKVYMTFIQCPSSDFSTRFKKLRRCTSEAEFI